MMVKTDLNLTLADLRKEVTEDIEMKDTHKF